MENVDAIGDGANGGEDTLSSRHAEASVADTERLLGSTITEVLRLVAGRGGKPDRRGRRRGLERWNTRGKGAVTGG